MQQNYTKMLQKTQPACWTDDFSCRDVLCSFIQSDSTITSRRFQSKMLSEAEFSPDRKFLTPSDKDNLFTIDHFPLWYRLAVENTPGSFLYYPVVEKGPSLLQSARMSLTSSRMSLMSWSFPLQEWSISWRRQQWRCHLKERPPWLEVSWYLPGLWDIWDMLLIVFVVSVFEPDGKRYSGQVLKILKKQ